MMGNSQSIEELEIPEPQSLRSRAPTQYIDLDKLKNADGITGIISQRISNRAITFALFKEFERDRRVERTSFIAASLRDSYLSMVGLVMTRIEDIARDGRLMHQLQIDAIGKLDKLDQEHVARLLHLTHPIREARR